MGSPSTATFLSKLDQGPEIVIAEQMRAAILTLRSEFRPRYPRLLTRIVGNVAGYPPQDHLEPPVLSYRRAKHVDAKFSEFIDAARAFFNARLKSDHYFTIPEIMAPRFKNLNKPDLTYRYLLQLEKYLPYIIDAPKLAPRLPPPGRPAKDLFAQQLVRAVFWYIFRCEKSEPDALTGHDGTYGTSKAASLAEVALEASGVALHGKPRSVLNAALKQDDWRSQDFGVWDLLPTASHPLLRHSP